MSSAASDHEATSFTRSKVKNDPEDSKVVSIAVIVLTHAAHPSATTVKFAVGMQMVKASCLIDLVVRHLVNLAPVL